MIRPVDPDSFLSDDPINDAQHQANAPSEHDDRYLPARMINEAVYCPRLFYLMHVEGQFAHNAETTEGASVHKRVDQKTDKLASPSPQMDLFDKQEEANSEPEPADIDEKPFSLEAIAAMTRDPSGGTDTEPSQPQPEEKIHARSVTLASDTLGVVAKLDLVEAQDVLATPVDYKKGKPRRAGDGTLTAWNPERVQICLQAIVRRENGFQCTEGVLYFHGTRQRVRIPIDDALIERTVAAVELARNVAERSQAPPPLVDSPKCPKCSLCAICLPDETNHRRAADGSPRPEKPVRLPATPRDDLRPLYLNAQGLYVGKSSEVLQVKQEGKVVQEVRLREINQVNLFGNVQISTQAMQTLLELEVPLVMHSQHGYFHGMLQGTGLKNILLRREQFRMADDPV